MPIHHQPHRERFTVIDRTTTEDHTLSFAARGLLAYLLGKPPRWRVVMADLVAASPAGEKSVRTLLQELTTAGYLTRACYHDDQGQWVWETDVYEVPPSAPQGHAAPGPPARRPPSRPQRRAVQGDIYRKRTPVNTESVNTEAPPLSEEGKGDASTQTPPFPDVGRGAGGVRSTTPNPGDVGPVPAPQTRAWQLALSLWRGDRRADYDRVLRHTRLLTWANGAVVIAVPNEGQARSLRALAPALALDLARCWPQAGSPPQITVTVPAGPHTPPKGVTP